MVTHLKLSQKILEKIDREGGKISFYDYMAMVLYDPDDGYYTGKSHQFGKAGDFITSPELSASFGRCLCKAILPVLKQYSNPVILEIGAGTGKLAKTLLEQLGNEIERYIIVEISPSLTKHQKSVLKSYGDKIHWVSDLESLKTLSVSFSGVVIANEVIDAFPVRKFHYDSRHYPKTLSEYYVIKADKNKKNSPVLFEFHRDSLSPQSIKELDFISVLNLPDNYVSEYQPDLSLWMKDLYYLLEEGAVLLLDYGFPRLEYYHPDRNQGTLMCHYQHRSNTDPLYLPGEQDITAHVDFTAVAQAGLSAGFELTGYTTQAAFLLSLGITEYTYSYEETQALKKLLLPSEMGELFKVMAFSKSTASSVKSVLGFELLDKRFSLFP